MHDTHAREFPYSGEASCELLYSVYFYLLPVLLLQFGRDRPNKGVRAPKIVPKMANISLSGVLRPNYYGVACLLLRMDEHSCCY